jgi:hypothetical protein
MVITAVVHKLIHMDRRAGLTVCYAVVAGSAIGVTAVLLIASTSCLPAVASV